MGGGCDCREKGIEDGDVGVGVVERNNKMGYHKASSLVKERRW